MTELPIPPEHLLASSPILALAKESGVIMDDSIQDILSTFVPRMTPEDKTRAFTSLHDTLQQLDASAESEIISDQIQRQIGIFLITAHAHYISEDTWPEVSQDLNDAYYMADESADYYDELNIWKQKIDKLIVKIAQQQYRTY